MSILTPRLRMFAGPNGSGKSTLFKSILSPNLWGVYINPDDIESDIAKRGFLNFEHYSVQTDAKEVVDFFNNSTLLQNTGLLEEAQLLRFNDQKLSFHEVNVNSYYASVVADFIRNKLIENPRPFTFETVMSSPDKIELLAKARKKGFRTYLYYVATEDPAINISRVKQRVKMGGHNVPEDKIISRYSRSLDLLIEAVKHSDQAYIFDNSSHEHGNMWLAEITDGKYLEIKSNSAPLWFETALLDKFR